MKRIELFEFEDFDWFPNIIRNCMTNLIMVLHKMLGTSTVITELIININKKHNFNQIVDLGSGSGGAMLDVIQQINDKHDGQPLNLILTDLYPNKTFINQISKSNIPNVHYEKSSVNATNLSKAPKGLKTMMNSLIK